MDAVPFRRLSPLAPLFVWAKGCEAVQGNGRLFLPSCVGNPIYASQSKSTQGRRHFEACKLRLLLGGIASLAAPFPKRPRGMHRKTYSRLRLRAEALELNLSPRLKNKEPDYPNLVY